jgi:hypothetical protein
MTLYTPPANRENEHEVPPDSRATDAAEAPEPLAPNLTGVHPVDPSTDTPVLPAGLKKLEEAAASIPNLGPRLPVAIAVAPVALVRPVVPPAPPSTIPNLMECPPVDLNTVAPELRDGVRKLNEAAASIPRFGPLPASAAQPSKGADHLPLAPPTPPRSAIPLIEDFVPGKAAEDKAARAVLTTSVHKPAKARATRAKRGKRVDAASTGPEVASASVPPCILARPHASGAIQTATSTTSPAVMPVPSEAVKSAVLRAAPGIFQSLLKLEEALISTQVAFATLKELAQGLSDDGGVDVGQIVPRTETLAVQPQSVATKIDDNIIPRTVCARCSGKGKRCPDCRGMGWLPRVPLQLKKTAASSPKPTRTKHLNRPVASSQKKSKKKARK